MMKEQQKHLYYLNELSDYKVDSHYADVRGWAVKDRDNRVIGKVDNLLVNKSLMRVVYLDVEVDKTIIDAKYDPYSNSHNADVKEFVNKEGENHIIVPIGMVHIHEDQKFVHTESIDHQTFAETKRFRTGDNVDRNYEMFVLDSYNRNNRDRDEFNSGESTHLHKESPYRADREAERTDFPNTTANTDVEWSEERRKLEQERHELRNERLKLEAERKKLENERRKHDIDTTTYQNNNHLKNTETNFNSRDSYPTDDSFYDRSEFDKI